MVLVLVALLSFLEMKQNIVDGFIEPSERAIKYITQMLCKTARLFHGRAKLAVKRRTNETANRGKSYI